MLPLKHISLKRTPPALWFNWRRWLRHLGAACAIWAAGVLPAGAQALQANEALLREQMAFHIGTLAYLYGYPIVDMARLMHNETHRVEAMQRMYAPVNDFYSFDSLVTPENAGNLRAPNNDTLYYGGWFDLSREPVVVHAPDTHGRYYTLAITDFYSEVSHVGRRTTGTQEKYFALVGPNWHGQLPPYMQAVPVLTPQAWILGRMLVQGAADVGAARDLVRDFWASPLSAFVPGQRPQRQSQEASAKPIDPIGKLEFFGFLNAFLRLHPGEPSEAALMGLFDQIQIGPQSQWKESALDAPTRQGLERAIVTAEALIKASTQSSLRDVRNGWVFPTQLGRFGQDYVLRASVAKGGYANAPEETMYMAKMFDASGQFLQGSKQYHLHLRPEEIPPAGAFWSLIAYDLETANLIPNPLQRYSLGDRTPGLSKNADGSLDIWIQHSQPPEGSNNWLPVGSKPFYLVIRIYEPAPSVFTGTYVPGALLERGTP